MRRTVLLFVLAACGGNTPSSTPDLKAGIQPDLREPLPDLRPAITDLATGRATSDGFLCGSQSCSGGSLCCVTGTTPTCASSCPDGGFVAQCRSPDDCGGNPCCVNVDPGYVIHNVSCTDSPTACPPAINVSNGSGQERGCRVDSDCTSGAPSTMLPDCCTNTGTMQHTCFNKLYVGLVMGFTCP
jgi:hypothetical protein